MTIPERNLEAEPRLNPQMEIELILARQLMSYLGVPMFLVDPRGDLLFYNEAAEGVLGIRFEETGRMMREEWARVFSPTDVEGTPITPDTLPLVIALEHGRPASAEMYIHGLDDSTRHLHVIGMPVIGLAGKHLGALAILWEVA
ncbi:MAG: PAS domain-containing protein [Gemmatimonadota bacterium]